MKKLFLLIVGVIAASTIQAQDTIVMKNADEVQAKVTAISPESVSYKRWSNLEGPTYTIPKSDIFYIKYQNGEKDVMQPVAKPTQPNSQIGSSRLVKLQGYVNLGAIFNAMGGGPTFDVNVGARIHNYFYVGVETGFHSLLTPYEYIYDYTRFSGVLFEAYVPLGINLKGYFTKSRVVNPFINCSLGGFFGIADLDGLNGFFCQAGAGIDVKRFSFGIGYSGLVKYDTAHCGYVKLGCRFGK